MPHLDINLLALVLDRPVMTTRGKGILSRIKTSGMQCAVTLENGTDKWFYDYEIRPILKPMIDVNVAEVTIKILTEVGLKAIHDGYDSLEWLDDGRAILDPELQTDDIMTQMRNINLLDHSVK